MAGTLESLFNRATAKSAFANAAYTAACTIALNIFVFSVGWTSSASASAFLMPPGWLMGGVWIMLYVFYGLARWRAVMNVVSLVFTVLVILGVIHKRNPALRPAMHWLLPSLLWECYAVVLGFEILST